ncbi:unannotated protein [freshwater metagenome]|uniref:Unannotated protein n=1 Tax=freshwater metagenome TaxID=449393 RepID=A0A6J7L103_9ZZZZ
MVTFTPLLHPEVELTEKEKSRSPLLSVDAETLPLKQLLGDTVTV